MTNLNIIHRIVNILGVKDIFNTLFPYIKRSFFEGFATTQVKYNFEYNKPNLKVLDDLRDRVLVLSEKSNAKVTGDISYQLIEGLQQGESITELKKRIGTVFDGSDFEKERIARTETIRSMKAGTEESFNQAGVWGKQWIAAMGNKRTCELCKKLNGQIVPVGENFINPETGEEIDGNMIHPMCRCGIKAVMKKPTDYKKD